MDFINLSGLFQSKKRKMGVYNPPTFLVKLGIQCRKMLVDLIMMIPEHYLFVRVLKIESKSSFCDSKT
jgi:hypothetical protein